MIWLIICAVIVLVGFVAFFGAPYVPSQKKYIRRAFDHFGIGPSDTVVDIGSGDGVVLRVAATYGALAVGYEIHPVLVVISRMLSRRNPRITTRLTNAWHAALPDSTTFVYAFSVSRDEEKLTKLVEREANRLGRPLKLLCLGSPFSARTADETFEAYYLYIFQPLQLKKA